MAAEIKKNKLFAIVNGLTPVAVVKVGFDRDVNNILADREILYEIHFRKFKTGKLTTQGEFIVIRVSSGGLPFARAFRGIDELYNSAKEKYEIYFALRQISKELSERALDELAKNKLECLVGLFDIFTEDGMLIEYDEESGELYGCRKIFRLHDGDYHWGYFCEDDAEKVKLDRGTVAEVIKEYLRTHKMPNIAVLQFDGTDIIVPDSIDPVSLGIILRKGVEMLKKYKEVVAE